MALSIRIKLPKNDGRVVGQEFDAFEKRMANRTKDILEFTIQEELTNKKLRVEEDLAESWEYDVEDTVTGILVRAETDDIAASALEYGTVPASGEIVNVAELLRWAQKKPVSVTKGTVEQFAWALAKKIGKQGLPLDKKGLRRPFANARKRAQRRINREWEVGIQDLVRKLNE